jgi:antitoxin VapB
MHGPSSIQCSHLEQLGYTLVPGFHESFGGNSEAVLLPKDISFGEGVELVIIRSGDVVTLYPAATSIPEMIARLGALPRPPSIEQRDDEDLPEREGL